MSASATANPRKRPRQERSSVTFESILEAAARILEVDGLTGLTTNLVAEKAGVSIGSLYQYFPSKQAILAELIRREREQLRLHIEAAALESASTLDDAVHRLLAAAVDHQLLRPELARVLEYAETALPLDDEAQQLNEAIVSAVSAVLRRYRIKPVTRTARDLVALAKGLIDAAGRRGENDRRSVLRRAEWAILGYLQRSQA